MTIRIEAEAVHGDGFVITGEQATEVGNRYITRITENPSLMVARQTVHLSIMAVIIGDVTGKGSDWVTEQIRDNEDFRTVVRGFVGGASRVIMEDVSVMMETQRVVEEAAARIDGEP